MMGQLFNSRRPAESSQAADETKLRAGSTFPRTYGGVEESCASAIGAHGVKQVCAVPPKQFPNLLMAPLGRGSSDVEIFFPVIVNMCL